MDAETALVDFKLALEVDANLHEEARQREAEEHAEAECKEWEPLLDQLRMKEGKEKLYAQLTMELQKAPENPGKGERPLNVSDSNLPPVATHKCPQPMPCTTCKKSGMFVGADQTGHALPVRWNMVFALSADCK